MAMESKSEPMKPIAIPSPPISATSGGFFLFTSFPVIPAANSFLIRNGMATMVMAMEERKIAPIKTMACSITSP